MVYTSAFLSQEAGKGPLTVFAVICHIPYVIQIEHTHARQPDRYTAPDDFCGQGLRLQVIRPAGAEQTEEEVRASEKLAEVLGADEIGYGNADMPEGTIVTAPYYFDVFVPVELKKNP